MIGGLCRSFVPRSLRVRNLHFRAVGPMDPWSIYVLLINYTLRFLGGRQPLCGNGVTSLIITTSMPLLERARIALSRPLPGPFTKTSTFFKPASRAVLAASEEAICAA